MDKTTSSAGTMQDQPTETGTRIEAFDVNECIWIPLADGCRLAARLWLPDAAENEPVATIFEFLPYRKRDVTRARDDEIHGYFAAQGFACLRVDMRGAGDSEGHIPPMYDPQERRDGIEVMQWIARQPWSNGKVGMIGLSWGGSIALQCAVEAPEELGAIVCVAGPHDSYGRDILYKGGCLINEVIGWATTMDALTARPPDPEISGPGWREIWLDRLRSMQPELNTYLQHQRRDKFWGDRDLTPQLSTVSTPTFLVGGWADSSVGTNPPDLVKWLSGPRKALIGPWGHKYPQHGIPGPAIDFLSEAKDWFDQHLRGKPPASPDPILRAWMLRDIPTDMFYPEAPGEWVAETQWPAQDIALRRFFLNGNGLAERATTGDELPVSTDQTVGLLGGELMPGFAAGPGDELPGDQSADDDASLCFTSEPLEADFDLLGAPEIAISLRSDLPRAMLAIRLNDVSPDGRSRRVSYAVQNLAHRNSETAPELLHPGAIETVRIRLHDIAYSFREGHRIRVAISTTYWPLCWPQPCAATVKISTGLSHIDLPERPRRESDAGLRPFGPPPDNLMPGRTSLAAPKRERQFVTDPETGHARLTIHDDNGTFRIDATDTEISSKTTEVYSIHPDDPLSAELTIDWEWQFTRGDWQTVTRNRCAVRCDADRFFVRHSLTALEGDDEVYSTESMTSFERDHM